ncbi:LysM peptidoglycan-binding domain-containing protein [Sinomonas susongensis]|uniref:LysM peptidoglycan-binding domain-containing protein n=1 Tax=Sinomonas susongensis TaxID=1324851 RepID=UPI001108603D|nr:LysM domain-containing protein [Sinomonas susongensis]
MKSAAGRPQGDAIVAALGLAAGCILAASGPAIAASGSTSSAEAQLGLGASVVGLTIVVWWLLAMTCAIAAAMLHAAGRQSAARWAGAAAPPFMRRLALAVLGATLAVGPVAHADEPPFDPTWQTTAPFQAAPVTPDAAAVPPDAAAVPPDAAAVPPDAAAVPPAPSSVPLDASATAPPEVGHGVQIGQGLQVGSGTPVGQGLQTEAWTPPKEPPSPGPLARPELRTMPQPSAVEVRPGDSLWSIAARHLGPEAHALEVADMWPKWFERNRGVIGDDPDILRPGQLLVPPNL